MAVGAMHAKYPLSYVDVPLRLEGTCGVAGGPNADGVYAGGAMTPQNVSCALAWQNSANPQGTNQTASANSSTPNDMNLFPASPAVNDGYYFGQSGKWFGLNLTVGTAAGSPVMTTVWEYWNGTSWTALTPTVDQTSGLQMTTTGVKIVRFVPPADWAPCPVAPDTSPHFWIRCRVSAFTSIATVPLGTQVKIVDLTHLTGYRWPVAAQVNTVQWMAGTPSATNNDSVFLLINATRGICTPFTLSKGAPGGRYATNMKLGLSLNDQLCLVQVQGDGVTEFGNVELKFRQRV